MSSAESLCRGEERREKGMGFSGPFDVIQSLTLTVKYKVSINERFGSISSTERLRLMSWTEESPIYSMVKCLFISLSFIFSLIIMVEDACLENECHIYEDKK